MPEMHRTNRTIRLLSTLVGLSFTLSAVLAPGAVACMMHLAHATTASAHHAPMAGFASEMPEHCQDHTGQPASTPEEIPAPCAMQLCVSPSAVPAATAEQTAPQQASLAAMPTTVVVGVLPLPSRSDESRSSETRTLPPPDLPVLHASFLI